MPTMQPVKQLARILEQIANDDHYLFSLSNFRSALPEHSTGAFKTLISRAEKAGLLRRVCRGIYLYPKVHHSGGLLLFHVAALLRASEFNYISLETALSDAGVISQIPINWITIMSSGRSNVIRCGEYGSIEFIHTRKQPSEIADQLNYDSERHLWRASIALAIHEMKATKRDTDLIDWSVVNESL